MSTKIYFKDKHNKDIIFSSDIFTKHHNEINVMEPSSTFEHPLTKLTLKKYTNLHQIMEDDNMFLLLTENSFTESELHLLFTIVSKCVDPLIDDERLWKLRHKISSMIYIGEYLPDDKNKIIKK